MQHRSNPDENDAHFPKVQPIVRGSTFKYRLLFGLSLAGVLVLFALSFVILLHFFSLGADVGCGNAALNSTCQRRPPSLASPTVNMSSTATPAATAKHEPTATSTPAKLPPKAPTPTGILVVTDRQEVTKIIQDYREYVLSGVQSSLYKAYDLLSQEVQNQESFSDFVKNINYTLPRDCLKIGDPTITQASAQTWDASILVTKVSCVDQTPEVYYSWHFQIHLGDGPPEITAIGLYPTGSGN